MKLSDITGQQEYEAAHTTRRPPFKLYRGLSIPIWYEGATQQEIADILTGLFHVRSGNHASLFVTDRLAYALDYANGQMQSGLGPPVAMLAQRDSGDYRWIGVVQVIENHIGRLPLDPTAARDLQGATSGSSATTADRAFQIPPELANKLKVRKVLLYPLDGDDQYAALAANPKANPNYLETYPLWRVDHIGQCQAVAAAILQNPPQESW